MLDSFSLTKMIPLIALIISLLAFIMQYNDKSELKAFRTKPQISEYAYKPEFKKEAMTNNIYLQFKDIGFNIVELNNLMSAYLIDSNGNVDKLKIEDNKLKPLGKANEDATIKLDIDAEDNGVFYRYKYLVTKSLNEDYDIFLIYSKEQNGLTNFIKLDEVEVMKLKSYPKESIEYNMLLKYKEIIDWITENKV